MSSLNLTCLAEDLAIDGTAVGKGVQHSGLLVAPLKRGPDTNRGCRIRIFLQTAPWIFLRCTADLSSSCTTT